MEILSNHCVIASKCLKAAQMKFTLIIHPSISFHFVGISNPNYALFWAVLFEWVIVSQVVAIGVVGGGWWMGLIYNY